ncbi:MAG: hypothetical protein WKF59_01875 [Chitinophagaceae bacterium]
MPKLYAWLKLKGKMVFMQFESEDCDQCNEVADKGLENKEVGRHY